MNMKKSVLLVVVALFVFVSINAQNDGYSFNEIDDLSSLNISEIEKNYEGNSDEDATTSIMSTIEIAILFGILNSTINGTDAESFDCLTGFHFGVLVALPVTSAIAIQPELLFMQMGSGYSEAGYEIPNSSSNRSAGDISGDYKLNYLVLPVSARYNIIKGLNIEAGPQFGFLLSAKDDYSIDGMTDEIDVKDQTKGLDIGVNAGASYKFDIGLYARARYYIGLTELNDLDFPGNESWKNAALQFSLGYFFN